MVKTELWNQLLKKEAIWVAYDEDIKRDVPYIGLTGQMEIFSEEKYAVAAQSYFAEHNEGNFSLRKIENIGEWFEYAFYIGATSFNLDNGFAPVQFRIEDYIQCDCQGNIDSKNRDIRSCLLRAIQIECRYNKVMEEKSKSTVEMYNQIISLLLSNGYTALANSTIYALVGGSHIEKTEIFSKKAFEKHKDFLTKTSEKRKYLIELEDELKIESVAKELVLNDMATTGNVTILSVENIRGLETMIIPNQGKFIPIFTDKKGAEDMRLQFLKHGEQYDCNIIAVTFAEIISILLLCEGAIVDDHIYSYVLPKSMLENIKKQMECSDKA